MTSRGRFCLVTVVVIATSHMLCASATGEPRTVPAEPTETAPPPPAVAPLQLGGSFLHLKSRAHVKTAKGSEIDVEPGYYVNEPSWLALDAEFKRLQETETRLTAENKSLRASMDGWQPGWKSLAFTLAVGIAGGVYAVSKL